MKITITDPLEFKGDKYLKALYNPGGDILEISDGYTSRTGTTTYVRLSAYQVAKLRRFYEGGVPCSARLVSSSKVRIYEH